MTVNTLSGGNPLSPQVLDIFMHNESQSHAARPEQSRLATQAASPVPRSPEVLLLNPVVAQRGSTGIKLLAPEQATEAAKSETLSLAQTAAKHRDAPFLMARFLKREHLGLPASEQGAILMNQGYKKVLHTTVKTNVDSLFIKPVINFFELLQRGRAGYDAARMSDLEELRSIVMQAVYGQVAVGWAPDGLSNDELINWFYDNVEVVITDIDNGLLDIKLDQRGPYLKTTVEVYVDMTP